MKTLPLFQLMSITRLYIDGDVNNPSRLQNRAVIISNQSRQEGNSRAMQQFAEQKQAFFSNILGVNKVVHV